MDLDAYFGNANDVTWVFFFFPFYRGGRVRLPGVDNERHVACLSKFTLKTH